MKNFFQLLFGSQRKTFGSSRIEDVPVRWNLEILGYDRGKRKILHQRTHNIVKSDVEALRTKKGRAA